MLGKDDNIIPAGNVQVGQIAVSVEIYDNGFFGHNDNFYQCCRLWFLCYYFSVQF